MTKHQKHNNNQCNPNNQNYQPNERFAKGLLSKSFKTRKKYKLTVNSKQLESIKGRSVMGGLYFSISYIIKTTEKSK